MKQIKFGPRQVEYRLNEKWFETKLQTVLWSIWMDWIIYSMVSQGGCEAIVDYWIWNMKTIVPSRRERERMPNHLLLLLLVKQRKALINFKFLFPQFCVNGIRSVRVGDLALLFPSRRMHLSFRDFTPKLAFYLYAVAKFRIRGNFLSFFLVVFQRQESLFSTRKMRRYCFCTNLPRNVPQPSTEFLCKFQFESFHLFIRFFFVRSKQVSRSV